MKEIAVGTAYSSTFIVEERDTAAVLGSGNLRVLGTPAMTAWMENVALKAIAPGLETTESSVGTALNITHDRACGVGEKVTAVATVNGVNGRKIDFTVKAFDAAGRTLGQGTHRRFIIDMEKFMSKIEK